MKNKNILKINIIYFIALLGVVICFLLGYLGVITNEIVSSILIQIVVIFAIPLLLYSLFVSKNLKQSFIDVGFKKISFKILIISIVLGFVLYFLNVFVANFFASVISLFGYENLSTGSSVSLDYGFLLKEFILSCILPGFCEEFLLRGIMLNASKKFTNTRYCLIISSILFGLMHLNINQFFYATILGFMMGYVVIVSGSIFPSMIMHFLNNFLSNYFYYGNVLNWPFARTFTKIENVIFSNIIVFVAVAACIITGLIFLYLYLVHIIKRERKKQLVTEIIKSLNFDKQTPYAEIMEKVSQIQTLAKHKKQKERSYFDMIFIISSFVLGGLITLSSFIWGVL